jgi:hypothetical protein
MDSTCLPTPSVPLALQQTSELAQIHYAPPLVHISYLVLPALDPYDLSNAISSSHLETQTQVTMLSLNISLCLLDYLSWFCLANIP